MFTHIFRYDHQAVRVPPGGSKLGQKLLCGDWACIQCKALWSFCARFDTDHAGDCPGYTGTVPGGATLPGFTAISAASRK